MVWSPAHNAVEMSDIESLVSLLDSGTDVDDPTSDGCTLLHHAIDLEVDSAAQTGESLKVGLTRLLVERGADLDHRWHGQTPLEVAEHRGHHLAVAVIRAARLSEAIVVWTGKGTQAWPHQDEARVVEHLGEEVAAELLPLVLQLNDEFYASKAFETAPDLATMGEQASAEFRQLHPEITEAAVEALAWCYTFDHK